MFNWVLIISAFYYYFCIYFLLKKRKGTSLFAMKLSNNFQKIQHTATLMNYIKKIEKTLRRDFEVNFQKESLRKRCTQNSMKPPTKIFTIKSNLFQAPGYRQLECAKLRCSCAFVPYVPTCFTCLRTIVSLLRTFLHFFYVLYMPSLFYVPHVPSIYNVTSFFYFP